MKAVSPRMTAGLAATVALASVLRPASTGELQRVPVIVVIHNHAAVPSQILGPATEAVTRVFQPLGIDVSWHEPSSNPTDLPAGPTSVEASLAPTIHFQILPHSTSDPALRRIVGVVAEPAGQRILVAQVLYQHIDDERTSADALAYVMTHLIAGVVESVGLSPRAIIVRGDREDARRLARGASPLTPEQVETVRAAVSMLATARH